MKFNSRGFSLVEVMVGSGVLVLGALFFATITKNNVTFTKQLRQTSDLIRENQAVKTLIENTPKETILYWMCPDPCFYDPAVANSYSSQLTVADNLLDNPKPCEGERNSPSRIKLLHPYVRFKNNKCEINPVFITPPVPAPLTGISMPPPVVPGGERENWRKLSTLLTSWSITSRASGRQLPNLDQNSFDGSSIPANFRIQDTMRGLKCMTCHSGGAPATFGYSDSPHPRAEFIRQLNFDFYNVLVGGTVQPAPVPAPSPAPNPYVLAAPFMLFTRLGQQIPRIVLKQRTDGTDGSENVLWVDSLFPGSSVGVTNCTTNCSGQRTIRSEVRFRFQSHFSPSDPTGLGDIIRFSVMTYQTSQTSQSDNPNQDLTADLNPTPFSSDGLIQ